MIEVRPLAGYIGAEIFGLDLTRPLDPAAVAEVREALLRWKVVFFREQALTESQHVAFGRQFGDVTPAHPTLPAFLPDHPEILLVDDDAFDGRRREASARGPESPSFDNRWHTDLTFVVNPPMGSILRAVAVPPYGGDTQWTNLAVAYEKLSPALQDMCSHLTAVHHNVIHLARGELNSTFKDRFQSTDMRAVHPVVRVHEETGERVLFVNPNFTSHICELTRKESDKVLDLLYDHLATPKFTCRFRWQPKSVAFWDNRATCHLIPADVPDGSRRTMHRITLTGDVPVGPSGTASQALSGEPFGLRPGRAT